MSARSRLLTKDEELGKRDDDFKPRLSRNSSMTTLVPWRWRRRRLLAFVLLILLLYMLLYHLPTGFANIDEPEYDPYAAVAYSEPSGAPPRDGSVEDEEGSKHYYNGVIRFFKLAQSLHKVPGVMGGFIGSRNVLFAASSLKSAANLIPMACEMGSIGRSEVHFALFGRSAIPLYDIIMLNGVTEDDCKVSFHDARGDFAEYSTDARAESATRGAMKHINDYMRPNVVIMDDSAKEDVFFTKGIRKKTSDLGKPLIEVPAGHYEDWLWMTRLEAHTLGNWFKPTIEILIHAPTGSSGGLIRLLRSLHNADYKGLKVPRLTIELPSDVEPALQNYLAGFRWPPYNSGVQSDSLTLRHRVPNSRITSEQASIRFVESFYPGNAQDNHVLILSPNVEVHPLYLQYLYYTILEYHDQTFGWSPADMTLGISLDIPTLSVGGQTKLTPPTVANMSSNKFHDDENVDEDDSAPFLYQGVSCTASLIFGEKWRTFHDFLSNRLQASHATTYAKPEKVVSETEPAWVEFLLELMRARGWTMLHPTSSFVTVHNELTQLPEEYMRPPSADSKMTEILKQSGIPEEEPFLLSAEPPVPIEHLEADPTRDHMPLHKILPFDGELQTLSDLPTISHEGTLIPLLLNFGLEDTKEDYVKEFRQTVGGCSKEQAMRERVMKEYKTNDLFCLPGVETDFADDGPVEADWAAHVAEAIADSTSEMYSTPSDDADDVVQPTKLAPMAETLEEAEKELT